MNARTVPTASPLARENEPAEGSAPLRLWDMDLRDTTVLKGLAISAIVFHNFFHAVSPVGQNEFTFDPARFQRLLAALSHGSLAIQALFSFFGHYGVQVFIFLSAYGLTKSYWDKPQRWTTFMAGRVRKLYPAFGLAVIPWSVAVSFQMGLGAFMQKAGLEIALMFVGLSTFLPGRGLPPVGPWWFIPFVVQLYAIWFLLRKLAARTGWRGLVVLSILCLAVTYVADPLLGRWSINLLETPIGRMPNICLGIVAARYPIRINGPLALASFAVFLAGCRFALVWPFSFLAALVVMLWMYGTMRTALRRMRLLELIGHYSLLIFLLNGIVRDQFASPELSPAAQLGFGCLSAAVTFAISALIHEALFARRMPRTVEPGGAEAVRP